MRKSGMEAAQSTAPAADHALSLAVGMAGQSASIANIATRHGTRKIAKPVKAAKKASTPAIAARSGALRTSQQNGASTTRRSGMGPCAALGVPTKISYWLRVRRSAGRQMSSQVKGPRTRVLSTSARPRVTSERPAVADPSHPVSPPEQAQQAFLDRY